MNIDLHCDERSNFGGLDQLVRAFSYTEYSIGPHIHDFYEMNIVLGGDLLQDIGDPLHLFHTRGDLPVDRVHPVHASEGSFLYEYYGPVFPVNSSHHQVVDRIGDGLTAVAWSESGLVEALQHKTLPIRTVQWHPERMSYANRRMDTVDGAPLFDWFIKAAQST